jgi:multicomponent K+:H+ antiporter subunit E
MIRALIPQPGLTLTILGLWLALSRSVDVGTVLLGLAAGVAAPLLTRRFWPDAPRVRNPRAAARLFVVFVYDVIVANFEVARLVLGPVSRLRSDFVDVPLEIDDPFVATLLGSIVSLTPGTVTTHIDMEARILRVHALDVADPQALIETIVTRYQRPLKETFGC